MLIDKEKCTGCGFCLRDCPLEAVRISRKKAKIIPEKCSHCGVCTRVCPENAVLACVAENLETVECSACPIKCKVPVGAMGACLRYENLQGTLVRLTPHHSFNDVEAFVGEPLADVVRQPLITAQGAGTTYPCCKPAPRIVSEARGDVDVVTVVTEVPLSYSSIVVKIDTDLNIGKEGADIFVGKRVVGMVETEQYGSKMLHIGGVNRLTGENGFVVARTITDIANKKTVKLKIDNGSRLKIRVGEPPIIDGKPVKKMRVGCGSATLGIFAPLLKEAADEVIVLDSHVTGQLSRHVAGNFQGVKPTGVSLKFKQSTPGRYFGDHGEGWGGTSIIDPVDIISSIDMDVAFPGMTLLITETTGQNSAKFQVKRDGTLKNVPLDEKAKAAIDAIAASCEASRVSAMYTGGSGGSARAGVTKYPIKLTRAVHENKVSLTVGGAPGFIMPGGGITFMVDVERVKKGAFYWTPTPATICPLEYTMTVQDYTDMGGHVEAMKPFVAVRSANTALEGEDVGDESQ